MKKLLALLYLLLSAVPALGQGALNKTQLNALIQTNLPDNTSGQITPLGVRNVFLSIVASYVDTLSPSQCAQFQTLVASNTGVPTCGLVTGSSFANAPGATLVGNPASATAATQSFTIASLPSKPSPSPTGDNLLLLDNSTGQFAKVTPQQLAGAITSGVSSISDSARSLTGNVVLGGGLATGSGNSIQVEGFGATVIQLYVSTGGNDTTTCRNSGAPCQTVQYAANQCNIGQECTVNFTAGTYPVTGAALAHAFYARTVNFAGVCPAGTVIIDVQANNATVFNIEDGAVSQITCMKFISSTNATGVFVVSSAKNALVDFDNHIIDNKFTGGTIASAGQNGLMFIGGNITLGQGATVMALSQFANASDGGIIVITALTGIQNPGAISFFYNVSGGGIINSNGATFSNGPFITGQQCNSFGGQIVPPPAIAGGVSIIPGTANTCGFNQVLGTPASDLAIAGTVGEYMSGDVAFPGLTLTSAADKGITSVSLTAGDWNVWGVCQFDFTSGTTTSTLFRCGLSQNLSMDSPTPGPHSNQLPLAGTGLADVSLMIGPIRVSLQTTTTYNLLARATFGGTAPGMTAYGDIYARRAR